MLKVTAGRDFVCAVLDTRLVKCWGDNAHGQLGLGDTAMRGDGSGEMGDGLQYVDLGTSLSVNGQTASALALSSQHACALLENTAMKCWGRNTHGQLGLGDLENRGDAAGEMGDSLPYVELFTGM